MGFALVTIKNYDLSFGRTVAEPRKSLHEDSPSTIRLLTAVKEWLIPRREAHDAFKFRSHINELYSGCYHAPGKKNLTSHKPRTARPTTWRREAAKIEAQKLPQACQFQDKPALTGHLPMAAQKTRVPGFISHSARMRPLSFGATILRKGRDAVGTSA